MGGQLGKNIVWLKVDTPNDSVHISVVMDTRLLSLQDKVPCTLTSAADDPSVLTITEKAPTRALSWLKGATTDFTFKTLLRHGLSM